jgi:acetyltransferase
MRAAASHTGALAGGDEVLDYALRRAGILRVREIDDLLDATETLDRLGPVRGDRLAIVTNGGGPGVLAADALVSGGGRVAELAPETIERLGACLPPSWSRGNPIDVIGDADAGRYGKAVEIATRDAGVDAVLLLYVPTAVGTGEAVARAVARAVPNARVPILCAWLGRESVGGSRRILAEHGLATYDTPEAAVRAFLLAVRHERARELLVRAPPSSEPEPVPLAPQPEVRSRLVAGRSGWLSAPDAMELLAAYGVPMVRSAVASDASAAAEAARRLGFPVALKLLSSGVLHKTEVGGVALDLESPREVEQAAEAMRGRLARLRPGATIDGFSVQEMARRPDALEVFVGAAVDPIFGPFVMFGQGGTAVEVIGDKAVALPPLDAHLADELMSRTRVRRLLGGYRGRPPADLTALRRLLVCVSQLVIEIPELVELDVNPVLVDSTGLVGVDARLRLEPTPLPGSERLSIRPYPRELEAELVLADGQRVLVRPIRPEDEATHRRLFKRFRPEDVRFRFFHMIRELPESELARYTQIDYEREMAFVAIDPASREELGVVRSVTHPSGKSADFAIIVAPDAAGRGLGGALLAKLVQYLRGRGVAALTGRVLSDNRRMLDLAQRAGFRIVSRPPGPEVEIRLDLTAGLRGEAAAAGERS